MEIRIEWELVVLIIALIVLWQWQPIRNQVLKRLFRTYKGTKQTSASDSESA